MHGSKGGRQVWNPHPLENSNYLKFTKKVFSKQTSATRPLTSTNIHSNRSDHPPPPSPTKKILNPRMYRLYDIVYENRLPKVKYAVSFVNLSQHNSVNKYHISFYMQVYLLIDNDHKIFTLTDFQSETMLLIYSIAMEIETY